jgi:hypothetical protein
MTSKFAGLALEVEKPSRMTIMHPLTNAPLRDKDGQEAWIELYSSDSDPARKHQRSAQRRRLASAGRRGRVKVTPEEMEADGIDMLVAITAGWNLLDLSGKPLKVEFNQDNARELYAEPGMSWLVEQIDTFASERENFSKASSKN